MKFVVKYGPFNTSYGTLELKPKIYNGQEVFHAYGRGYTSGLAKLFFKVDDTYESYFDKQTIEPLFFNRDIYEGGYTKKLNFFFDKLQDEVLVRDLEKGQEKKIKIANDVKDVVTSLFYFRNKEGLENLNQGDWVKMDMIFDNDDIFNFGLKFLGKETVRTRFGEVKTLKFCPIVKDGRVFKDKESLTVWVTDDKNRLPVKIKANLRVGSMVGELVDFRGLKHPTQLKKN